jgi:hypothetical protein
VLYTERKGRRGINTCAAARETRNCATGREQPAREILTTREEKEYQHAASNPNLNLSLLIIYT